MFSVTRSELRILASQGALFPRRPSLLPSVPAPPAPLSTGSTFFLPFPSTSRRRVVLSLALPLHDRKVSGFMERRYCSGVIRVEIRYAHYACTHSRCLSGRERRERERAAQNPEKLPTIEELQVRSGEGGGGRGGNQACAGSVSCTL